MFNFLKFFKNLLFLNVVAVEGPGSNETNYTEEHSEIPEKTMQINPKQLLKIQGDKEYSKTGQGDLDYNTITWGFANYGEKRGFLIGDYNYLPTPKVVSEGDNVDNTDDSLLSPFFILGSHNFQIDNEAPCLILGDKNGLSTFYYSALIIGNENINNENDASMIILGDYNNSNDIDYPTIIIGSANSGNDIYTSTIILGEHNTSNEFDNNSIIIGDNNSYNEVDGNIFILGNENVNNDFDSSTIIIGKSNDNNDFDSSSLLIGDENKNSNFDKHSILVGYRNSCDLEYSLIIGENNQLYTYQSIINTSNLNNRDIELDYCLIIGKNINLTSNETDDDSDSIEHKFIFGYNNNFKENTIVEIANNGNVFEINKDTGAVVCPKLNITDIQDPKTLVTKEYIDSKSFNNLSYNIYKTPLINAGEKGNIFNVDLKTYQNYSTFYIEINSKTNYNEISIEIDTDPSYKVLVLKFIDKEKAKDFIQNYKKYLRFYSKSIVINNYDFYLEKTLNDYLNYIDTISNFENVTIKFSLQRDVLFTGAKTLNNAVYIGLLWIGAGLDQIVAE
jgi:hypothetical protein